MSSSVQFNSGGGGGGGGVNTLTGNSGGAVSPSSGNINVLGDNIILTSIGNLSPNTLTFELVPASDGQVIIGSSSGNSAWANLTPGVGITITNASNSITISDDAARQYSAFTTDATPTPIITINLSSGYLLVTAQVCGAETGGGGGGGYGTGATITFTAGNAFQTGNVVAIVGTPNIVVNGNSAATVSASVDVGLENVYVNVVGVVGQNYNWTATYQMIQL